MVRVVILVMSNESESDHPFSIFNYVVRQQCYLLYKFDLKK